MKQFMISDSKKIISSILVIIFICFSAVLVLNLSVTDAAAETIDSENVLPVELQDDSSTVASYRDVFEYYYDIAKDRFPDAQNYISLETFMNIYYSQPDPIYYFADRISYEIFTGSQDIELNTGINSDGNVLNIQPRSGILEIISPDADYILAADIGDDSYTYASYFERAPIMAALDYSRISSGDIIYESTSPVPFKHNSFIYEPNHPSSYGNYVQTIEAVAGGVQYGFLDDDRMTRYGVSVHRVYRAAELGVVTKAKQFMLAQVGKPYSANFLTTSTDINTDSWYCSELVFAAYYYGGMDICSNRDFDFDPATSPCLPVYLTKGLLVYQISLGNAYLDLSVASLTESFWWWNTYWTINIYNPNDNEITVEYNTKMCYSGDARDWTGLRDLASVKISGRSSVNVDIYQNASATSVTASYIAGNRRYISFGTSLSKVDYTMSVANNKIEA